MIIAHCTDLHITPNGELLRGIDVRRNAEMVFEDIKHSHPDLLVLGGDLAATNGELGSYRWIKDPLEILAVPYRITPGNHNNYENLAKVFDLKSEGNDGLFRQYWSSIRGHYHVEKSFIVGNTPLFLTPATMLQIDPNSERYKMISSNPGWRFIEWNPGYLNTHVHYS